MVRESVECLSVKSPGCSVDVLISLLISLRPDIHTHTHNHANQKDTGFFWYWSNWTVMWPPNPPPSKHTHPFWRSIVGGLFNPLIKEHRGGCNPVTARRVMWGMRCVCERKKWKERKTARRGLHNHTFSHHQSQEHGGHNNMIMTAPYNLSLVSLAPSLMPHKGTRDRTTPLWISRRINKAT